MKMIAAHASIFSHCVPCNITLQPNGSFEFVLEAMSIFYVRSHRGFIHEAQVHHITRLGGGVIPRSVFARFVLGGT